MVRDSMNAVRGFRRERRRRAKQLLQLEIERTNGFRRNVAKFAHLRLRCGQHNSGALALALERGEHREGRLALG